MQQLSCSAGACATWLHLSSCQMEIRSKAASSRVGLHWRLAADIASLCLRAPERCRGSIQAAGCMVQSWSGGPVGPAHNGAQLHVTLAWRHGQCQCNAMRTSQHEDHAQFRTCRHSSISNSMVPTRSHHPSLAPPPAPTPPRLPPRPRCPPLPLAGVSSKMPSCK